MKAKEGCQVVGWCPLRSEQGVDGAGTRGAEGAGYLNANDG